MDDPALCLAVCKVDHNVTTVGSIAEQEALPYQTHTFICHIPDQIKVYK